LKLRHLLLLLTCFFQLLTTQSRCGLEKPVVTHMLRKLITVYGIWKFISTPTVAPQVTWSWTWQEVHTCGFNFKIGLSSSLGLWTDLFYSGFPTKVLHAFLISRTYVSYSSRGSNPSRGKITFFTSASRPAVGPTQPLNQWLRGPLSPGVKRPGHEAYDSPPSSAEVKNDGTIPQIPHMSSWLSTSLMKHRDNFTVIILLALIWHCIICEVYSQSLNKLRNRYPFQVICNKAPNC
jgi:hypothetical protein